MAESLLIISFEAHKNQLDKSGMPYVYHTFHVAEQMKDEYSTCVALLHDVVEDTDITLDEIKRHGFPDEVIEALSLMTHSDDIPYLDYIRALKDNPIARKVKLADLAHNNDLTRLDRIDDKAIERINKYKQAILILERAEKQSRIKKVAGKQTSCCNNVIPADYQFCPSCGKEIVDSRETDFFLDLDQTLTSCANCGKLLILYGAFCGYCGKRNGHRE